MDMPALEAPASKGTIHHRYPGKDALFEAVIERLLQRDRRRVDRDEPPSAPARADAIRDRRGDAIPGLAQSFDRRARLRTNTFRDADPDRWVVESTLARLARFRRLAIRYERRADSTQPSNLACALITLNPCKRFCQALSMGPTADIVMTEWSSITTGRPVGEATSPVFGSDPR